MEEEDDLVFAQPKSKKTSFKHKLYESAGRRKQDDMSSLAFKEAFDEDKMTYGEGAPP